MDAGVERWLDAQPPEVRAGIAGLRAAVQAADQGLTETIKWNAPSFAHNGADRVTLGVDPKGGFRMVLHRGAKVSADSFRFDDPGGLARWPATDRGVVQYRDAHDVAAKSAATTDLVRRWILATG